MNDFPFHQFAQSRQCDARMRAIEHSGAIGARRFLGELELGSLLDNAVETLQGRDGFPHAYGIADLNSARERFPRGHRCEMLEISQVR